MIVSVYSFTNVFTYFNDYLLCRSTGADIGGLKVRLKCSLQYKELVAAVVAIAIKVTSTSAVCTEHSGVF